MSTQKYTDDQLIEAHKRLGSLRAVAREFGVAKSGVQERFKRLASKGYAPDYDFVHPVPDGFRAKRVSTGRKTDDGFQWVIAEADKARQDEMMREACEAMIADLPKLKPRKAGKCYLKSALTAYPIGDPHFGMLAWQEECGDSWDLQIAEKTHCESMARLIESSPPTEQALIVNLGDALHYDGMIPVTARSGNFLDADGRYAKMARVAVKVIRQCIESALEKHKTVHVKNVIGNHDEVGAVWLSLALAHVYANEPRVTVDTTPSVFSYFRFGNNLIGCHHGHTCKAEKLPGVMATDRAKDWGETEHRYWYTGHVHHAAFREFPGVSVESFGTLAAKDAYAANGGWRSRRSMTAIVLDKQHGEVARNMVRPEMLGKAA